MSFRKRKKAKNEKVINKSNENTNKQIKRKMKKCFTKMKGLLKIALCAMLMMTTAMAQLHAQNRDNPADANPLAHFVLAWMPADLIGELLAMNGQELPADFGYPGGWLLAGQIARSYNLEDLGYDGSFTPFSETLDLSSNTTASSNNEYYYYDYEMFGAPEEEGEYPIIGIGRIDYRDNEYEGIRLTTQDEDNPSFFYDPSTAIYGNEDLTKVILPSSLMLMLPYSFANNAKLTDLTIQDNLLLIAQTYDWQVFNLEKQSFENIVIGIGSPYKTANNKYIIYNDNVLIANYANAEDGVVNDIPADVTEIGAAAFRYRTDITSVVIPNTIERIGEVAFETCENLTSITWSENELELGQECFMGCGFVNLTLPAHVSVFHESVFNGCTALETITIPSTISSTGVSTFSDCSSLTQIIFEDRTNAEPLEIGESCFNSCTALESITLPENVVIGSNAFSNCSNLQSVTYEGTDFDNMGVVSHIGSFYEINPNAALYVKASAMQALLAAADSRLGQWDILYENGTGWDAFKYYRIIEDVTMSDNTTWCDISDKTDYCIDLGNTLTVANGATLTVNNTRFAPAADKLVLEEGAQLVCSGSTANATVKKSISGNNSSKDDNVVWNFIASPVNNISPAAVTNMTSTDPDDYDLYYYDEASHYWKSYDAETFNLMHGKGYLYTNNNDANLSFGGAIAQTVATSMDLSYVSDNANLKGFNLVGNPFTCKAGVNRSCYTIQSAGGEQVIAATTAAVIDPCTAVMVKATAANQQVTFTPAPNPESASAQEHNQLNISLNQTTERGNKSIDNAIISFDEDVELEKFVFNKDNARVYIPQRGSDYAIVVSDNCTEMPLYVAAPNLGRYTLTVVPENVEMDYLHLIDNLTGDDIDMLLEKSYTFVAKSSDKPNRFKLVYRSSNAQSSSISEVFAYQDGSDIVVTGNGTLQVFDVTGRFVGSYDVNGVQTINAIPKGVYIFRMIGDGVKTQKIVVR